MNKWFGLKFNFKWPHDGFVFGFSIDYYDPTEDLPWESYVFRIAFVREKRSAGIKAKDEIEGVRVELWLERFWMFLENKNLMLS